MQMVSPKTHLHCSAMNSNSDGVDGADGSEASEVGSAQRLSRLLGSVGSLDQTKSIDGAQFCSSEESSGTCWKDHSHRSNGGEECSMNSLTFSLFWFSWFRSLLRCVH